jgi:penicillin-binding protein 1A
MLRFTFFLLLFAGLIALLGVAGLLWYVVPGLPQTADLNEAHLQTPMRVFTTDGKLIAEFGEKRRHPTNIEDVPLLMKQAFIAAEDDRFYEHPGVDWIAIMRAVIDLAQTGAKRQGGSTMRGIFFLAPKKLTSGNYVRSCWL